MLSVVLEKFGEKEKEVMAKKRSLRKAPLLVLEGNFARENLR